VNKHAGLYDKNADPGKSGLDDELKSIRVELHRTVKFVTHDIEERMQYNTAIARMMELINVLYQADEKKFETGAGKAVISEVFGKLVPMLSPFVPHMAEELWELMGNNELLVDAPWPEYDEGLTTRSEMEIVFQVNGKIRAKEMVSSDTTKEEMEKLAREHEKIKELVEGKDIKKVIVVPGKLVNIVAK
jgi:leucyl-tRNA synthetase